MCVTSQGGGGVGVGVGAVFPARLQLCCCVVVCCCSGWGRGEGGAGFWGEGCGICLLFFCIALMQVTDCAERKQKKRQKKNKAVLSHHLVRSSLALMLIFAKSLVSYLA